MSRNPGYTPYHPRWLRPRMSTYWWLGHRAYTVFILRELSSVFVAWSVIYLLLLVRAVSQGGAAYARFVAGSGHPAVHGLNLIALGFVVFHAVTWFNLAPSAIVLHVGKRRVPGIWVAGANYLAWAAVSAVVAWALLGG